MRPVYDLPGSKSLCRCRSRRAWHAERRVYMERLIRKPRHIEVQVVGDSVQSSTWESATAPCAAQPEVRRWPRAGISQALSERMRRPPCFSPEVGYVSLAPSSSLWTVPDKEENFAFMEVNPGPGGAYHHRRGHRGRPGEDPDRDCIWQDPGRMRTCRECPASKALCHSAAHQYRNHGSDRKRPPVFWYPEQVRGAVWTGHQGGWLRIQRIHHQPGL
jgi:hypothetical protein